MAIKGIDISTYQRNVDFKKLKAAGVNFVILRAGYGNALAYPNQYDDMFESHYKNAKAAGLNVGAYWYLYATTVSGAQQEAKSFLKALKGKKFEYPVYIDLEERSQFNTGRTNCSNMVRAFCDILENAGYWSGLYISRNPLQNYITPEVANRYSLWVAEYASKCNYNGQVDIWQYTSSARYNGFNGNLDGDYSYKDYPTLIKNAGKNGYTKPAEKVLDTKGMKENDKNLGVYELKSMLSIAEAQKDISTHIVVDNTFGPGTTKVVNDLLKKWGYKQNGIAGEGFIKKLTAMLK